MSNLSEKGVSYTAGFFILIAFAVGGMILAGAVSIPVLTGMTGRNALDIAENMKDILTDPEYLREMQVVQSISAIFGFLVPTLVTAWFLSKEPAALTGFKGAIHTRQLLFTLLIIVCGLGISSSLGYLSYQIPFPETWKAVFENLEDEYAQMAANLINMKSIPELIISIIVLALIPAVCEEAFFRGGLQNYMYRASGKMWLSVIIVSLIFSAVHFSAYGFLSRFALGIILGLLYQYSGRLWLSILAHFINNAAAILMVWSQKSDGKNLEEIMSDKSGSYLGLLALPIVIYLFTIFRKTSLPPTISTNGI